MTSTAPRSEPTRRSTAVLLGGVTLVGLLLRLPGLNSDLWLDEIATLVSFVRQPLGDVVVNYVSANNHVLYSILAHVAISAFGEASWTLRLPALLFGAATVPALYYLARAYAPRGVATAAALVLAVSYHHIYFSQNARGYTGLVFFSVLSTGVLARAVATNRARYWAGFAVLAALNVYVLLSGLFVVVGQVLGVFAIHVLRGADRSERRQRVVTLVGWTSTAAALTLLLHAPLLGSMVEFYTTASRDVGWTAGGNLVTAVLRDVVTVRQPAVVLAGAALIAPVVGAGLYRITRVAPLLLFALALPSLIELGVAMLMGVGTFPRRFLVVLPLGVLVAVFGTWDVSGWLGRWVGHPRWSGWLFGAAVGGGMVVAAWGLPRLYRLPKQDYRGALHYVEARREPGDVVAAAYVAELAVQYYGRDIRSARTAEDLAALLLEGRRIWLVGTLLEDMRQRAPDLDSLVSARFRPEARFPGLLGDGDVVVWRSNGR